ncbi:hypothetical protein KPP03845_107405 [Streptomyces xanthophaeus]|uniref:hypothetical protein n=1 Tax=Streptomyces TaxID=1883 RepID=UPI00233EE6CF|nr:MULTISPECIES: hypothetical protein [Streptomyces]WCD90976.1 hypothetical protein KPP03845_107405 [Streptomyces xanthophaeus]
MAKKKPATDAGVTPVQADDTIIPNQQPAPADAGIAVTAAPQSPAADDAREELLKAIASEATAISTGKEKGKSAAALEALARAYSLVATGQPQIQPQSIATRQFGNYYVPSNFVIGDATSVGGVPIDSSGVSF